MKKITLNTDGKKREVTLVKGNYLNNNNVYIAAYDGFNRWCDITTNFDMPLEGDMAFLDMNNSQKTIEALPEGSYETIGMYPNGYCVYPIVRLNKDFLDEIQNIDDYLDSFF